MDCASVQRNDGEITWSQLEDFFLFFPTFTGVVEVEEGLACVCGVSTRGLPLRSVEGVVVMPLTLVGAGDEAMPLKRVDTPFTPLECV
jgi:hypothetical protein